MRFVVLMYSDPEQTKAMTPNELATVMTVHRTLGEELTESGELVGGEGLALPGETKTLQLESGAVQARNGPLTDFTEQLTAYYVLECADLDRAKEIAARVVDFHVTSVEIRSVHDSVEQ